MKTRHMKKIIVSIMRNRRTCREIRSGRRYWGNMEINAAVASDVTRSSLYMVVWMMFLFLFLFLLKLKMRRLQHLYSDVERLATNRRRGVRAVLMIHISKVKQKIRYLKHM